MGRRRKHVHPGHVFLAFFDIALRNFFGADAFFICRLDNLVIDVGKVRDVIDLPALVFKIAAHGIENDHRTRIADMDEVIDRRAADIHADLSGLDR